MVINSIFKQEIDSLSPISNSLALDIIYLIIKETYILDEEMDQVIDEIRKAAQDFCSSEQKITKEALRKLAPSKRAELAAVLNEAVKNLKKMLSALNIRCPYCRKEGGEYLGKCVKCGRDMCSLCGKLFDGEPLHSSVCAMWHKKDEEGEKEE